MRRAMVVVVVAGVLAAGCGSSTNDDEAASDTTLAPPTVTVAATTSTAPAEDSTAPLVTLATPEQVSAALDAAGLPCPLVPVVKDPSPLGPDVDITEYSCVLGYEKLTVGFYESAEARSSGLDAILAYFGPFMKNFGLTEVSYVWSDDEPWTATVEPATEGFTPEITVPVSEADLLGLVADALHGEVHVIPL